MDSKVFAAVLSALVLTLAGCTTIAPQPITYIGEATLIKNVQGSVTHTDFAGIGVSADSYAGEYNRAVAEAFRSAPSGTKTLKSLKTFKAPSYWPQAAGLAALVVGSILATNSSSSLTGGVLVAGGYCLEFVNTYDYVVLGEPSQE